MNGGVGMGAGDDKSCRAPHPLDPPAKQRRRANGGSTLANDSILEEERLDATVDFRFADKQNVIQERAAKREAMAIAEPDVTGEASARLAASSISTMRPADIDACMAARFPWTRRSRGFPAGLPWQPVPCPRQVRHQTAESQGWPRPGARQNFKGNRALSGNHPGIIERVNFVEPFLPGGATAGGLRRGARSPQCGLRLPALRFGRPWPAEQVTT